MPGNSVPGASTLLEHDGTGPGWGPLVDGNLIRTNPGDAAVRVPSIFGSNTHEGSLALLSRYGPRISKLNQSTYDEFLRFNFGPLATAVNQTYSLSRFARTQVPGYAAMMAVLTTYSYRCAAYRGLKGAVRNGVPAWTYSFSHTPSCAWHPRIPGAKPLLRLLGPTHSAELPFVFNLTTHMPPPTGECFFSRQERELASTMSALWTSMAATGKPGDDSEWPQWTMGERLGVNINSRLEAGEVDYSMCENFWDHIMDGVKRIAQPADGFEEQAPDLRGPIQPLAALLDQQTLHEPDLLGLDFLVSFASWHYSDHPILCITQTNNVDTATGS
jgi:carboxylesterase type B